ncbi:hypothetical protein WJX81_005761 [Elliptochloris bilobata]|uniref:RING-type domain-containing protein n=1 Tax=Elliptochloris bilobata TaxID=381761 RepID=A0AAW1QIK9_9CHLO
MGQCHSTRYGSVGSQQLRPQGLSADADEGAPGEECPICFLRYPSLNRCICCSSDICTECYVQVRWRRGGVQSGSACPFCKGIFAVTYRGPLSDKDRAVLAAERAALAAAQQRARENEEREADEQRRLRLEAAAAAASAPPATPDVHSPLGALLRASLGAAEPATPSPDPGPNPCRRPRAAARQARAVDARLMEYVPPNILTATDGLDLDLDLNELMLMQAIYASMAEQGAPGAVLELPDGNKVLVLLTSDATRERAESEKVAAAAAAERGTQDTYTAPPDPADAALRDALDRRDAAFQHYLARVPSSVTGSGEGSAAAAGNPNPSGGGGARWESDAELAARLNAADAALLAALSARGNPLYPEPNPDLIPSPDDVRSSLAVQQPAGASAEGRDGLGAGGDPDEGQNFVPNARPRRMETDTELAARLNAADAAFAAALNARDAGARRVLRRSLLGWGAVWAF